MTVPMQRTSSDSVDAWAIVQRAQTGDQTAIAELYQRYQDVVFRFVYFRVGNRPLAEDISQDTWTRALKRIGTFTWQGKDPGAWLVTIARNLVADHFKSGRYRLEITTGDVLDADRHDDGDHARPEHLTVEAAIAARLRQLIGELNEDQRRCIELRYFHGYNVAETAALMGRQEGALKALQYRAVRTLARLIGDGIDDRGRSPLSLEVITRKTLDKLEDAPC